MRSADVIELIGRQFAVLIEALDREGGKSSSFTDLWAAEERARELEVFSALAGGATLPFFRQNYLEISAGLASLAYDLRFFFAGAPPAGSVSSEVLDAVGELVSRYGAVWSWIEKDGRAAERELVRAEETSDVGKKTAAFCAALKRGGETEGFSSSLYAAVADLRGIGLSLKKFIVVSRL